MENKIIVCIGASCSGKSTFAEQYVRNRTGTWIEVNRDNVRFSGLFNVNERNWTRYKFSRGNENKVSKIIDNLLDYSLSLNSNIVVSDTNLSEKARNKWKTFASENDYEYEEKWFVEDWETLRKRNIQRVGGISEHILWKQYKKMCHYTKEVIPYSPPKDKVGDYVLVDIDGTVATTNERGFYDWHKVGTDLPKKFVINMLHGLMGDNIHPIFMSGRDGVCKDETYDWIMENVIYTYWGERVDFPLFMRSKDDMRKDYIVKMELFDKYVRNNFNIVGVLDDRPQVLSQTWDLLDLPNIINVGGVYNEF